MSTMRKCQVVMLPTKEKAPLYLGFGGTLYTKPMNVKNSDIYQHLYFLSDEEIKEGEWICDAITKKIFKSEYEGVFRKWKKIIATTDYLLNVNPFGRDELLPQPSQSFLEEFVKEYNKGNQIKEVLVEYDLFFNAKTGVSEYLAAKQNNYLIKVSKDNTITIRRAKETFTKREAMELCIGYAMWCAFECNSPEQYLIQNIGLGQVPKMYSKEQVANLLYATWNHAVEVSHATHIKTNDPLFKDWLEQKL